MNDGNNGNGNPPILIIAIGANQDYIAEEVWEHPKIWFAEKDDITSSSEIPTSVRFFVVNNDLGRVATMFQFMVRARLDVEFQAMNPIAMGETLKKRLIEYGALAAEEPDTPPLPPPPKFTPAPPPSPKIQKKSLAVQSGGSGCVIICNNPILVPNEARRFFEGRRMSFLAAREVLKVRDFPPGTERLIVLWSTGDKIAEQVISLARNHQLPAQSAGSIVSLWDKIEYPPKTER